MTSALVVDDSKVDQRFVGTVMSRAGIQTVFAGNGREAMAVFEQTPLDLIVTDMQMPEMDGLELVLAVRKTDPLIPIILVTAHGSEELAMKALGAGASSYVAKRQIPRDLPGTVEQVLSLANLAKDRQLAASCLVSTQCQLVLSNDYQAVGPVIHYLRGEAERLGLADETKLYHLSIALDEAFTNAIDHGNLEVSSALREPDSHAYLRALEERRTQPPYADRRVHVTASFTRQRTSITIRDEGPGFERQMLEDPRSPENLTKPFGRGLFLIHTFTEEVRHNDAGNEITLIKRHE
jgi:CheY-like chemotaxis protein